MQVGLHPLAQAVTPQAGQTHTHIGHPIKTSCQINAGSSPGSAARGGLDTCGISPADGAVIIIASHGRPPATWSFGVRAAVGC